MPARTQAYFGAVAMQTALMANNPRNRSVGLPVMQLIHSPNPSPSQHRVAAQHVVQIFESLRKDPRMKEMADFKAECDKLIARITTWQCRFQETAGQLRFEV